jgi:hypothetical protein
MGKLKRPASILAAALIIAALCGGELEAASFQPPGPSMALGLNGHYALNRAEDHDNLFGFGLSFCLALTPNIALEVSGQFDRGSTLGLAAPEASILSPGRLLQVPLQVMVQLRLPIRRLPLIPYLTAGGGYSVNSFSLDDSLLASYEDLGYDLTESVDGCFVFGGGLGFDVAAFSPLIINLHVLYRFGTAKGEWTITDQVSSLSQTGSLSDIDLKALIFGVGLKYFF